VVRNYVAAGASLRRAAVRIATRAAEVWTCAELGVSEISGSDFEGVSTPTAPLTDDQLRSLWGKAIDRETPIPDRITLLTDRIKVAHRRRNRVMR